MKKHSFTWLPRLMGLIGTLLVAQAATAATITVRVGTVEAQAGSTVEVPINVAGANGIGAVHLELAYDPQVLEAQDVTRGALAGSNALVDSNPNPGGPLVIGLVSLDGITGDGVIATARFKVVGQTGQSSDLTLQNSQAWERESHAEALVKTEMGKVTIAAGMPPWLIPALIAAGALLLLLLLIFALTRRGRRPEPQPAYASAVAPPAQFTARPATTAAMPHTSPPPSFKESGSAAPPLRSSAPPDLPERGATPNAPNAGEAYKRTEDEYFRLKGQLSTGRITREQFDEALRGLMVQDAQGRHWMIGPDSGKWYVHDGQQWMEGQPY